MHPLLQAYLTPSSDAVKFAIKGTLAMFLALYVALWADLERPYWALISAAFLQIRPMSGMVIEKGLYQLGGTFVGVVAGTFIMALFAQARIPALYSLTLWLMLCVYGSSMTRNNAAYGCIMAAVSALLVVVLAGSNPTSTFDVAVARLSELGLGAICATLVSGLLWPTQVKQHLATQADTVVNQAFLHAAQRLEPGHGDSELQQSLTASLGPLMTLETDSQAARYEGPAGPGRVRATHELTRHTVAMFASLYALNQLLGEHRERLGEELYRFADDVADGLRQAERIKGVPEARSVLQQLRHRAHQAETSHLSALQQRVWFGLREILGQAMILLDAREAITRPGSRRLRNSPSLSWHRDRMVAGINAARAGIVFSVTAIFWLVTGWNNGPVAMMLATLFSAFFASRDNPARISMMFFKGMLAAIPSAFIFGHVLLAQANGFPMLAMLFGAPLFIGLLGAAHPAAMGYSLAFTIGNILLTMPGNGMDFGVDSFLNRALAVVIGLTVVVLGFRMIPGPGPRFLRRRLVSAIGRDLHRLTRQRVQRADAWFSGRMADRLLRLAHHDELLPEQRRVLFSLGLTGLDVGRACLRLRQRLDDASASEVRHAHRHMLDTLARAYQESARGQAPRGIEQASDALIEAIARHGSVPTERRILLAGLLERVGLTLQRQARLVAGASEATRMQSTTAAAG
ncbi:FUSC family protein [Halomonas sp. McH1-25]|uniref:FUSC family protein n=1 Tax=unclassified Halomonas TaxID=2609666 RepID=UPI001EF59E54|nr:MULTISPECIES: FUSC family protein [unclassified Halomonas]MCG7599226.1 FUSC family protein [Halomonas sp. McH1-25]MCP1341094.1 FUSC family protein [Halomonas sp. FL8]MCP1361686.1 FUSC family protein [Halomonas sp. BBD45]